MTSATPAPRYNRAVAIAAISDFYHFLTHLPRLSESDIIDAPAAGWPELTDAFLAPLAKSQAVNDLIRHLPYISDGEERNSQIAPEGTSVVRYNGPDVRWSIEKGVIDGTLTPVGAGRIPPHVAVLTDAGRYGSWLLLDTEEGTSLPQEGKLTGVIQGTITDYIQFERPERSTPSADSPDHWRAYRTLPIAEFFEEWKAKYLLAEWVVLPEEVDDAVRYRFDAETDEVREIYREHGWPDAFRQDECRRALIEWCDRKREA
ncbi:hypothetical protein GE09DRAFT_302667 [Coniochaeta sp. 2T2.1]|nr:hypothetical protein GE09DRAFT_302667 [Coniochaeta sp. 2T2.1]